MSFMTSHVNSSCRSLAIYSFKAVSVTLHGEIKKNQPRSQALPSFPSPLVRKSRRGFFVSILQATESWVGLRNKAKMLRQNNIRSQKLVKRQPHSQATPRFSLAVVTKTKSTAAISRVGSGHETITGVQDSSIPLGGVAGISTLNIIKSYIAMNN